MASTLFYPGAGFDVLTPFKLKGVVSVVCIDMLPCSPGYENRETRFLAAHMKELFAFSLKEEYGMTEVESGTGTPHWRFEGGGRTLRYYHNLRYPTEKDKCTLPDDVREAVKACDGYLHRGSYSPAFELIEHLFPGGHVYLCSDTAHDYDGWAKLETTCHAVYFEMDEGSFVWFATPTSIVNDLTFSNVDDAVECLECESSVSEESLDACFDQLAIESSRTKI